MGGGFECCEAVESSDFMHIAQVSGICQLACENCVKRKELAEGNGKTLKQENTFQ